MEQKLADYRARKAREAKIAELKTKTKSLFNNIWKGKEVVKAEVEQVTEPLLEDLEEAEVLSECSEDDRIDCLSLKDCLYYLLWFIFWAILYAIFIEYQFGTVFFVISAIVFIFFNTRTRPKRHGEVSAYSVFNKNCESIDGTLKAEQFEREIRYGHL